MMLPIPTGGTLIPKTGVDKVLAPLESTTPTSWTKLAASGFLNLTVERRCNSGGLGTSGELQEPPGALRGTFLWWEMCGHYSGSTPGGRPEGRKCCATASLVLAIKVW